MTSSTTDSGPWTVGRLLQWTKSYFEQNGVESPRLCSEILLAHAMKCQRLHLFTQYEKVPEPNILNVYRASVKEAAAGKPIAYITGSKEFFSLSFTVTPEVLIPRPETEIMVERVIRIAKQPTPPIRRILDIGTGTGCIPISLAKHVKDIELAASDISEAALEVARQNASTHEVTERIEFRHGDLLTPWTENADPFDIIVSNPPYVALRDRDTLSKGVRDFEPNSALFAGEDGLDIIRKLVADAPRFLSPGGHLLFEMGYDHADAVRELLESAGVWAEIVAYKDGGGHERIAHARLA